MWFTYFLPVDCNGANEALCCTILFKIKKKLVWLFPIHVTFTFTFQSYTTYIFGIMLLKFLFIFKINFVWNLVRFSSKIFSYLSKTFLSLFSSLVRYFEKWVVNFQISYFKNSNLNCFLVFFVLVRHTQSTKNYLSFLYIQHLKLRIVKLPKTLLLKFHVFKFKWKSNSGVVGTKERYIKPEKWFWRNVKCLMPGFLILHISYKQRVSFI